MDRVDDESHPGLLFDADVLIDYLSSPLTEDLIPLAAEHFGPVAVVPFVFKSLGICTRPCPREPIGSTAGAPT